LNADYRDTFAGMDDPDFKQWVEENQPAPKPYSVKRWSEVHDLTLPPRECFLGSVYCRGQLQALVAQGGLGKSRLSLCLARHQVLRQDFAGFPVGSRPYRWLFIGNENSTHRLQEDVRRMTKGLSAAEQGLLNDHIFLHTLDSFEDALITIGDPHTIQRWSDTLAAYKPEILVVDPWDEVRFGDPNDDADTRASLRELLKLCRKYDPDLGQLVLHHARTGRQNIAQATGWDKANFSKGSKAFYSSCRSIINLSPADKDDHTRLVMSCGKCNDARPFKTIGLRLHDDTGLSELDQTFDEEAWRLDLEGKHTGVKVSIQDVIDCIADGHRTASAIESELARLKACTTRTVRARLQEAKIAGFVRQKRNEN